MIQELHLLRRWPAGGTLHLQRHELGDAIHLAVADQVGRSDAQTSVQRPALADHHVTRPERLRHSAQIPACDLGRLPGPAGADVVAPEPDAAAAVGKLDLLLDDAARDLLGEAGFDPVYGARPLKRAIQQQIENPLAQRLLQGVFVTGDHIRVGVDADGRLEFGKSV